MKTQTKQTKEQLNSIMIALRDFIDTGYMDAKAFDLLINAQDNMRKASRLLFSQEQNKFMGLDKSTENLSDEEIQSNFPEYFESRKED